MVNEKYFDEMQLNHFDFYGFECYENKEVRFCFSCNPSGLTFGTLDAKCSVLMDDGTYPEIEDIISCVVAELKNDNYMDEMIDIIYHRKINEMETDIVIDDVMMKQIIREDLFSYITKELSYNSAKVIQDNLEKMGAINIIEE